MCDLETWSFRCRTNTDRQSRLTLGVFLDAHDLEKARKEATMARVVVDEGGDSALALRQAE